MAATSTSIIPSITIMGQANERFRPIPDNAITKGEWSSNVQHSFAGLTECSCGYLDRFSSHGGAIRQAYEDAVVAKVSTLFYSNIIIAVVGSGGLLQEACWLTKLFYQNKNIVQISLHLIDLDYAKNMAPVQRLANYAQRILPTGTTLVIQAWRSCQDLQKAVADLRPHLVIGMDTEHATSDAASYQWGLSQGDVETALFIKWEQIADQSYVRIYSRKGSMSTLNDKQIPLSEHERAAQYINNAIIIG